MMILITKKAIGDICTHNLNAHNFLVVGLLPFYMYLEQ